MHLLARHYYYYTVRFWYPEDMITFTSRSESSTPHSVFSPLFWARMTKSERVVKQSQEMQLFHYANLVHIFGISRFPPDGMRSHRTHKCAKKQQVFQAVINSGRKGLRNRHTYACYGWDWNLNLWEKKKQTNKHPSDLKIGCEIYMQRRDIPKQDKARERTDFRSFTKEQHLTKRAETSQSEI